MSRRKAVYTAVSGVALAGAGIGASWWPRTWWTWTRPTAIVVLVLLGAVFAYLAAHSPRPAAEAAVPAGGGVFLLGNSGPGNTFRKVETDAGVAFGGDMEGSTVEDFTQRRREDK